MRLAALDYGTVTTRLLVADVTSSRIHQLLKKTLITHLGEGLADSGSISAAAMLRVISASREYLKDIENLEQQYKDSEQAIERAPSEASEIPIQAVATSAMRDALNSSILIAALAELGIPVQVIAGEREATLSFSGTLSGFAAQQIQGQSILVLDIGGGSTELTLGYVDKTSDRVQLLKSDSFDIGARRVTDRWLRSDPPTEQELLSARQWIAAELASWFSELNARGERIDQIIAVAGTATTLVSIREQMTVYDPAAVHGQQVNQGQLVQIIQKLSLLDNAERCKVVGLEAGRAPVVVGGMLILDEVLRLANLNAITVSETDILQGIILDAWQQLSC